MSIYDQMYWCPADDCGGDVAVSLRVGDGERVVCPHCRRAYTLIEDGDTDDEGRIRDASYLHPVRS